MMLAFQTGDICVEEKVSVDTELHIKSCMITTRGEIQTENKSRLLQMELAFGSSQSSNKIATRKYSNAHLQLWATSLHRFKTFNITIKCNSG